MIFSLTLMRESTIFIPSDTRFISGTHSNGKIDETDAGGMEMAKLAINGGDEERL